MTGLRTEADLLRTLKAGTYRTSELYARARAAGMAERDGGSDLTAWGEERLKHRVRCAQQALRRAGRAESLGDGVWYIDGTPEVPTRALLLLLDGEPSEVELVLGDAAAILRNAPDPIDLIVADPCWGLSRQAHRDPSRDRGERIYARDSNQVLDGYVDVDPSEYAEFTHRWVEAAAEALRDRGGYLAAVTGPQQAARVQVAGEDAGLTYVNQVVVKRPFALRTTRRFAHAHFVVTVLCAGSLDSAKRTFTCPDDLPKAKSSGADYPLDWWDDVPKYERRDLLRYDNALPPTLVRRLVLALSAERELVADPFLGSGTTAVVAQQLRRSFYGGDLNRNSLRFCMARMLAERPTPTLFDDSMEGTL